MNRVLDPLFARVMRRGKLDVIWADGSTSRYGDGSGLPAAIHFKDRAAEWRVAINPLLALGEMYMDDRVEFPGDTLLNFIMLANENWGPFTQLPWVAALFKLRFFARHFTQNNNRFRSRRNVAHHYDLDERLYRLFLDRDMQYSCAYFETQETSLEEAQWAKKRHIAAKLALKPGQQVLDIGSGWGGSRPFPGGEQRRGCPGHHAFDGTTQGGGGTCPRDGSGQTVGIRVAGLPHPGPQL
jgi:cyclopropane-fatty-acyl-phospholipid synthase